MGKWKGPGALRGAQGALLAAAPVQQRGLDLEQAVGALRRPAHLPALIHAGVDQVVNVTAAKFS